jgi:hypothetical protein
MYTAKVWKKFAKMPLDHWVAISLDGARIIANGPSMGDVCDKARGIRGDEFVISKNPLALAKPLILGVSCFA